MLDEDWNDDLAKIIALVLVLVLILGVVLWLVLWLVLVLVLGVVMVLKNTKVFLFLGAYFHYRERMKKSETLRRG